MPKNEKSKKRGEEKMIAAVIKGVLGALVIMMLLNAIGAVVIKTELLPENMKAPLVTVSCLLGMFTGGVWCVLNVRARKFLTIMSAALLLILVLSVVAAFDSETKIFDSVMLQNTSAILTGGIASGLLCGGRRRHKAR